MMKFESHFFIASVAIYIIAIQVISLQCGLALLIMANNNLPEVIFYILPVPILMLAFVVLKLVYHFYVTSNAIKSKLYILGGVALIVHLGGNRLISKMAEKTFIGNVNNYNLLFYYSMGFIITIIFSLLLLVFHKTIVRSSIKK